MHVEERRRPAVGAQVKRWRRERGLTLATVAERSGLNVGYLSQIENDKASPSLTCLGVDRRRPRRPDRLVPDRRGAGAAGRPRRRAHRATAARHGRIEQVDGNVSRDLSIIEAVADPGTRTGAHSPFRGRASHRPARPVAADPGRPRDRGRARRLRALGRHDPARRGGARATSEGAMLIISPAPDEPGLTPGPAEPQPRSGHSERSRRRYPVAPTPSVPREPFRSRLPSP